MLLGHILQFGLRSVQEALARDAAAADGDFALVDVIARSAQVFLDAQGDLDARLLVRFQHVVEGEAHREQEHKRRRSKADGDEHLLEVDVVQHAVKQIEQRQDDDRQEEGVAVDMYAGQ